MYKLAATNRYTWNYLIFTDEQDPMAVIGLAERVLMSLLDSLSGCHQTVVVDNFFTSHSPARGRLLAHNTCLLETLRSNRAASGKEIFQKKLKCGEAYGLQNKEIIKMKIWKHKKHIVIDTGSTNFRNESIHNPQVETG